MKVIGIVGSRRKNSSSDLKRCFDAFTKVYIKGDTLVSGGCPKGGDRFAEKFAEHMKIPIKIHPAEWNKYGKSAGFKRNGLIAQDADILIAIVSDDRTGGTEDTIKKAEKLGKRVIIV